MTKNKKNQITPKQDNRTTPLPDSAASLSNQPSVMAEDSDFTLVSYARQTRDLTAHAAAKMNSGTKSTITIESKHDTVSSASETSFMQSASSWRFMEFQRQLVPVIQELIADCSNPDHPFIRKWINATTGPKKMTRDSNFTTVAKALELKGIESSLLQHQMWSSTSSSVIIIDLLRLATNSYQNRKASQHQPRYQMHEI
jgi:hypothetical protein